MTARSRRRAAVQAHGFVTIFDGFRVSRGASKPFCARVAHELGRDFSYRCELSTAAPDALIPGRSSVGAIGEGVLVSAHGLNPDRGAFHAADEENRTSETAIRVSERV